MIQASELATMLRAQAGAPTVIIRPMVLILSAFSRKNAPLRSRLEGYAKRAFRDSYMKNEAPVTSFAVLSSCNFIQDEGFGQGVEVVKMLALAAEKVIWYHEDDPDEFCNTIFELAKSRNRRTYNRSIGVY